METLQLPTEGPGREAGPLGQQETRTPSRSREPDSVLGPPGQQRTRTSTERGLQLPTVS